MEHGPFVEFVQKYFVDMKPTWHSDAEDIGSFQPNVDKSIAQYVGGLEQVKKKINLFSKSVVFRYRWSVSSTLQGCKHSLSLYPFIATLYMV